MKFQCSKCGACCRRAGLSGFMPQREDGACIYLAEDNTCKIYATRPELCNMDKMYEVRKKQMNISKKDYFILNNEFCNEMIKEDKMSDEYLINIKKYDE